LPDKELMQKEKIQSAPPTGRTGNKAMKTASQQKQAKKP